MLDPATIATLGGVVVNVGGGLLGDWLAQADDEQRRKLEQRAAEVYGSASAPAMERILAEELSTGEWDAMPTDFGRKGARDRAIDRIVAMGLQGGMDAQSRLALEQGQRAAALQERQGREAVRQEARRRGLGGAGEVTAQLMAQQQGADRAALTGLQAASDARSRALASLAQGGAMAAQAEGQDFERAARIAQSRDAIRQANANMRYQAANDRNRWSQQGFQNDMLIRDRRYDSLLTQADQYGREADRKRKRVGGMAQSGGYALNSIGQNYGGGK